MQVQTRQSAHHKNPWVNKRNTNTSRPEGRKGKKFTGKKTRGSQGANKTNPAGSVLKYTEN